MRISNFQSTHMHRTSPQLPGREGHEREPEGDHELPLRVRQGLGGGPGPPERRAVRSPHWRVTPCTNQVTLL